MVFIDTLSSSKEDTFDQCKFKYKGRYVDYIPPANYVNEDGLNYGNYIHKIFELGFKSTTFSELETIAKEIGPKYKTNGISKRTETCFKNFLAFSASFPKDNQPKPEWHYKVALAEGINYQGIIDRLVLGKDGGLLIIDWKTGKEKNKIDLIDNRQLIGYALAGYIKYGIPFNKITCSHFYPVTDKFISLKYSKVQIANFIKERKDKIWTIRKLKKEQLLPCKNEYCNFCEYKKVCPLYDGSPMLYEKLLKESKENKLDKSNRPMPEIIEFKGL